MKETIIGPWLTITTLTFFLRLYRELDQLLIHCQPNRLLPKHAVGGAPAATSTVHRRPHLPLNLPFPNSGKARTTTPSLSRWSLTAPHPTINPNFFGLTSAGDTVASRAILVSSEVVASPRR
jgi:hypothetical protein